MMEVILFVLVIFAILFACQFFYELINVFFSSGEDGITSLVIFIFLFISTIVILCELSSMPKAIDVYRGNTTLEITSVNGVPTDTVVVWKNKK
jgi:hypothetical protein